MIHYVCQPIVRMSHSSPEASCNNTRQCHPSTLTLRYSPDASSQGAAVMLPQGTQNQTLQAPCGSVLKSAKRHSQGFVEAAQPDRDNATAQVELDSPIAYDTMHGCMQVLEHQTHKQGPHGPDQRLHPWPTLCRNSTHVMSSRPA